MVTVGMDILRSRNNDHEQVVDYNGHFRRLVVQPSHLDPVFACGGTRCCVTFRDLDTFPLRLLLLYFGIGHSRTCRQMHR